MEKRIQIGKKTYTLTANRKIIKTLYNVCPEVLNIAKGNKTEQEAEALGTPIAVDLFANLDVLFFDMIKIAHPEIAKEKSDEILDQFCEEYENVADKLLSLAMSVFTEGSQSEKKKKQIDW